ncbi:hypothetical protein FA95DRAFT_1558657 [Auriscalpium vulgare]|uniref:Uncharacterized protein n=1 Tax=Auriscalpium vulgare TaxID=40419 RepID=A0ACB8RUZ8_9AGAM|nr:hypothetical protein FA95DRAFT_1558657 [Auriscalpium vulgare]
MESVSVSLCWRSYWLESGVGPCGVAGILDVVMHAPAHIVKPHAADIEDTVAYVIGLQDSHGNWPSKAGPRRKNPLASENTLIQWCHGAPGILTLLSTSILSCSTLEFSSELENSLVSALVRGASLTHSRGLLRKGPGLCHGVGGTATVLFQAADALASQPEEQRACLRRALHLLQCYAELRGGRHFAKPDRPWSLYEGVAGAAAALTEALERVEGLLSQGAEGMGMPRGHPSGLLGSGDLDLPARA